MKVVVLGERGVGKSTLTRQFVSGHFVEEYDPTIEDSYTKKIDVDGSSVVLDILDTSGQEEFSAMRDQYIRTGEAFILVYSINDLHSFDCVRNFKKLIDGVRKKKSVPILLVGNMSDREAQRMITTQDGEKLASEWSCPFFETSAEENYNIQEIFHEIVREERKQQNNSSVEPQRSHNHCVCL